MTFVALPIMNVIVTQPHSTGILMLSRDVATFSCCHRLSKSRDTGIDVNLLHDLAGKVCWSHVTHHTSHITRHASHVTHHTSHITRHTSHVTHHTLHTTHHTSHITHNTPHITHHQLCALPAGFSMHKRLQGCWHLQKVNQDRLSMISFRTVCHGPPINCCDFQPQEGEGGRGDVIERF